ncbi:MAG: hypothetical protein ACOCV2_09750 [Persicimonas sp.]
MTDVTHDIVEGLGRLAIVGVAKNCGKTTTLNHLLNATAEDRNIGLVSVGLDGESADLLIGTDKPRIVARRGTHLVTTDGALGESTARVEYVEALGIATPLGEVVVARVLDPGSILLAGLRHRADLQRAGRALEAHGCELVFIDGAYGRTVAARPDVAEAAVVSTGAVLSSDIDQIVARTTAFIERLALEPTDVAWQTELIERAVGHKRCLLGGPAVAPRPLCARSALIGLAEADGVWSDESVRAVAIPGLVSDGVVEHLLAAPPHVSTLLVPDGTVLKARADLLLRLRDHFEVRALSSIEIRAISVNPTGPRGRRVDRDALIERLANRWPSTPVVDPLFGSPLAP